MVVAQLKVVALALVTVIAAEIVITVAEVVVLWVEAVALGWTYFLLISSTPPTKNPVSFNLTHPSTSQIVPFRLLTTFLQVTCCDSVYLYAHRHSCNCSHSKSLAISRSSIKNDRVSAAEALTSAFWSIEHPSHQVLEFST